MAHFQTSQYELFVPRQHYANSVKTHVLVKLTLLHDRTDIPFIQSAWLQYATSLLSECECLPNKAERTLSMTGILLHLLVKSKVVA